VPPLASPIWYNNFYLASRTDEYSSARIWAQQNKTVIVSAILQENWSCTIAFLNVSQAELLLR
jgi:hypothetical protein